VEANPDGPHRPETFTIYGPDNECSKISKVDDNGETTTITTIRLANSTFDAAPEVRRSFGFET
jgi:hypothetical protein